MGGVLRPVFFVTGVLLLGLGAIMAIPAAWEAILRGPDVRAFAVSAMATAFFGGALALSSWGGGGVDLSGRRLVLAMVAGGLSACACASLPFALSDLDIAPIDAVFEAVSGLTTTGATLIPHLDQAPKGVLLWRAILNGLGGLGAVVMAVAVLPALRIGGMQMFRMETSDRTGRVKTRASRTARTAAGLYLLLCLLAAAAFRLAGMAPFDALCHGLSAISTGGFSTRDGSLAAWGAGVQWVAVAAMIAGASPLPIFTASWRRWPAVVREDGQFRAYLALLAGSAAALALWRWASSDADAVESLRQAVFAVVSIATTTGFVDGDWLRWGGFAHVALFLLAFVGGCAGGAGGGVKAFRWRVLLSRTGAHIRRLLHPHGMFVIDLGRRRVGEVVINSVMAFVALYMVTFALFALGLAATGVGLPSALAGSAAALGNVGRGLGTGWLSLPDPAKLITMIEMLLGRFELFTLFVLVTPGFWKR